MNGKKAKLLRKYGKVEKKTKKMYNSLNHNERGLLTDIYEYTLKRREFKEQMESK